MKAKYYLLLCLGITLAIALTILWVPGVADGLESWLLRVLSTNARI
jgi:hypothetical protein